MYGRITRASLRISADQALKILENSGWELKVPTLFSKFFSDDDNITKIFKKAGNTAKINFQGDSVSLEKWATDPADAGSWYVRCDPNEGVWDISILEDDLRDAEVKIPEDHNPPDENWMPPEMGGEICECCHGTGFAPHGCGFCGL